MVWLFNFWCVIDIKNHGLIQRVGQRVRVLRESKGLSQEKLANDAGIPINQIGRIERGEINTTISTLNTLADALGMTMSELLEDI